MTIRLVLKKLHTKAKLILSMKFSWTRSKSENSGFKIYIIKAFYSNIRCNPKCFVNFFMPFLLTILNLTENFKKFVQKWFWSHTRNFMSEKLNFFKSVVVELEIITQLSNEMKCILEYHVQKINRTMGMQIIQVNVHKVFYHTQKCAYIFMQYFLTNRNYLIWHDKLFHYEHQLFSK